MRFCEHPDCGAMVDDNWPYAWCKNCGDNGLCHHNKRPHECNECFIESDLAYDGMRERGFKLSKLENENDD